MDRQDPPNRPCYQLTWGLTRFRQQKRHDDLTLSRQEARTMRHLADAHSVTGSANISAVTTRLDLVIVGRECQNYDASVHIL